MANMSKKVMGILALLTSLSGFYCYSKNKDALWLAGSAVMFAGMPYTMIVMGPTYKYLGDLDAALEPKVEISSGEKHSVLENLNKWLNLHRGRIVISLAAAVVFYLA